MGFREGKLLNKGHLQINRNIKTGVWCPLTRLLVEICSHMELQLMCALSPKLSGFSYNSLFLLIQIKGVSSSIFYPHIH